MQKHQKHFRRCVARFSRLSVPTLHQPKCRHSFFFFFRRWRWFSFVSFLLQHHALSRHFEVWVLTATGDTEPWNFIEFYLPHRAERRYYPLQVAEIRNLKSECFHSFFHTDVLSRLRGDVTLDETSYWSYNYFLEAKQKYI